MINRILKKLGYIKIDDYVDEVDAIYNDEMDNYKHSLESELNEQNLTVLAKDTLKEIIKCLEIVDTDRSKLLFKCNGNTLFLKGIEKKRHSNNVTVNLTTVIKKGN